MDDKTLAALVRERQINGEDLLLARSPVFKVRYTWDGDIDLGCAIGCTFCYYRWIDTSMAYIGTGRLRRLAGPREMVRFLRGSRLFHDRALLILGARSDASMYMRDVLAFLEAFEGPNSVLILHRAPVTPLVVEGMRDPRLRFGTTITPGAHARGWTPIDEEAQLRGLERLLQAGVDPDRVGVQVGPLTTDTLAAGEHILARLRAMGFRHAIVRGTSFGSFNVAREPEMARLQRIGFLNPEAQREPDHEYYVVKNWLPQGAYERLAEAAAPMRVHRRTYTLYSEVWGVPVAKNRGNRVRVPARPGQTPEAVCALLRRYGLDGEVTLEADHYRVTLSPESPTATEDVAMTVGAFLDAAVVFDRYRRTAALEDLRWYRDEGLLAFWDFLEPEVRRVLEEAWAQG